MARPLPVNLLLAATGGVLLVSGLGGKSIGDVLKGEFGNLTVKNPNVGSSGEGQAGSASFGAGSAGEGGPMAPSPVSFSSATFAASPTTFAGDTRHAPTRQQQAAEIARILVAEGITHPTSAQIQAARLRYERETGVQEFASETDRSGRPYV